MSVRLRESTTCPFELPQAAFQSIDGFPDDFDDACFAQSGIELPARIAASVTKRRKEFYFGRVCAREAMRRIAPGFSGQIGIGQGGRPLFPDGFEGSISHDADRAVAICQPAGYGRLGLDLEPIMSADHAAELWQQIAVGQELGLANWRDAPEALRLTSIFSAKEALFKAIYPDILCVPDFSASRVVDVDLMDGWIRLRLEEDLGGDWRNGREIMARIAVDDGSVLTLVSALDCQAGQAWDPEQRGDAANLQRTLRGK